MTDVFCVHCGKPVSEDARFCPSCGRPQTEEVEHDPEAETSVQPVASPDAESTTTASAESGPQPAAVPVDDSPASPATSQRAPAASSPTRRDTATQDALDFGSQLGSVLRTPGVVLAASLAGIVLAVSLLLGLLAAFLTGETSTFDLAGRDGLVTEMLRQAAAFSLAPFEQGNQAFKATPALGGLLLSAASALAAYLLAKRVAPSLGTVATLVWAAAGSLLLAIALTIVAVIGGPITSFGLRIELVTSAVFFLTLLLSTPAALAGAAIAIRRSGLRGGRELPERARLAGRAVIAAAKPLAAVLIVFTIAGTVIWAVQTLRDAGGIAGEEGSTAGATLNYSAYAVEHGVHFTELGTLFNVFENPVQGEFGEAGPQSLPVPVTDVGEVVPSARSDGYGLFAFGSALPIYLFIPALGLFLLLAVAILYAGYSVARAVPTPSKGIAVAIAGPTVALVWALTMTILNALVNKPLTGSASTESVFLVFLLLGGALGSLGALLVGQRAAAEPPTTQRTSD